MNDGSPRVVRLSALPVAGRRLLFIFGLLLIVSDLLGPNPFVSPDHLSLEIEIALGLSAIFIAACHGASAAQKSRLRNALVVSLLSLLVAGASAEAATRWIFRHVTASADGSGYFGRRWRGGTMSNSHGFRDREFDIAKHAGTYRIVAIGDSFTFGNGLPEAQRYTNLLQTWLPDGFEVLNFGVPGNNTPHHLASLRGRALPARPDFVLLQWFVNDIEGNDLSGRPHTLPLLPVAWLHGWLDAHSALYTVANMRWAEMQIALGMAPSYAEYLKARAEDANSPDAKRESQLLHEFVDLAKRANTPMAIVLFPDPGQDLGRAYPFAFLHERVLAVCRQEAIPCIDLREDLAGIKDRRTLWVSPFDHHPSARANEIAALRILDRLQPRWTK